MKWELVPATAFGAHRDPWQELNARATDTPVLHPDFVEPLLAEWGTGREVLAIGRDRGRPSAMLLLAPYRRLEWTTFQPSQAPIGLLVRDPAVVLADVARGVAAALPPSVAFVSLTHQDPDLSPRPVDGGRVRTVDYMQTARLAIQGPFEAYWSARGSNLRHNLRRQRRALERAGVTTWLDVVTQPEEVAGAVREYGELETAGWKGRLGTAVHAGNDQGRFYRAILERFCARGEGLVFRYRYGERVVAMDLCIHRGGTAVILKTAHDSAVERSSPALLMREEAFRHLFDTGRLQRIEFYGRLMDWHTKWAEDVRTLYHLNFARWAALWTLYGWARRLRERLRPGEHAPASAEP